MWALKAPSNYAGMQNEKGLEIEMKQKKINI